jgi:hypothetical protein
MPDCGTISPGLNSCAMLASGANLSTICETEFNQTAFRFTGFAGEGGGEGHGSAHAHIRQSWSSMRIATYNVNGINGRLGNLLGWLKEAAPDIVCLQELKAPDDKFPAAALRATTKRYAHLADDPLRSATDRFGSKIAAFRQNT